MPQLFSRTDDMKWLTPTMADILDQGANPPGGDGTIREQMVWLQQKFSELGTPARVVNVRSTPSYTLFLLKPETTGRIGNRYTVTANDIKRSLGQIAEERREWKLGFLPTVQESADSLGILLKTDDHHPLTARRLMIRTSYRDHPSRMAVIIGNSLEQRLIIYDIAEIGNLAIVGDSRENMINSILVTLLMLNTPAEMRIGLLSQTNDLKIAHAPHALGRTITQLEDGVRLLAGLQKELDRRHDLLANQGVTDIDQYNASSDQASIPRIMLLVDTLSSPEWQQAQSTWLSILRDLLKDNGKAGIHLLVTVDSVADIPSEISDLLPTRIITRGAARDLIEKVRNFHGSLMRFIDGMVISGSEIDPIIPVEGYVISDNEINNVIGYWRRAAQNRQKESKISGRTGVTKMLTDPTAQQNNSITQETVVLDAPAMILKRSQALASYLGWIGVGPLQDVMGLSLDEATQIINTLKQMGIVEDVDSPTPRFSRLGE